MTAPPLEALGWDDTWSSELEQLEQPDLIPARIAAQHRGAYLVWTEHGQLEAKLSGKLQYEHAALYGLPAVGDWIAVRPTASMDRAVVHAILPRRSGFSRKEALSGSQVQTLAANVDVAFLLSGLDEDYSLRRLERYLTTAWESGASPVVVLTKTDLHPDVEAAAFEVETVAVGVPVHPISNLTGEGIEAVAAHLAPGRTAVLLGSSGVGKSTLLNRLAGQEVMRTSEVAADGTGRHTTSHRELILLPSGAMVIDTPGLRELQLWEGDVESAFDDIEALAANCRFRDCSHNREPGCDVLAAVDDGRLELDRLRSWRKLLRELEAIEARSDKRLHAERKRRWKLRAQVGKSRARP